MSDERKQPVQEEELDKVAGGVSGHRPTSPPGTIGPPPNQPPGSGAPKPPVITPLD